MQAVHRVHEHQDVHVPPNSKLLCLGHHNLGPHLVQAVHGVHGHQDIHVCLNPKPQT